jgi:hypothetical protein
MGVVLYRMTTGHMPFKGNDVMYSFAVNAAKKGSCGVSIDSHAHMRKNAATLAREPERANPVCHMTNSPMSDPECLFVPVAVCHGDFATLPKEPRCRGWTPTVPLLWPAELCWRAPSLAEKRLLRIT